MTAPALAELQRQMRATLTRRDSPSSLLETITDVGARSAPQRLDVYTQAYLLRLVECLASDFPATHRALGEASFRRLAEDYFSQHPSSSPNISDAGEALSSFSRMHPLSESYPFLEDLTTLEWAVLSSLYTDRWPALNTQNLQAVPAAAWAHARLHLDPTVRLLKTNWAVDLLWEKRRAAEPKRKVSAAKKPRNLLLYRDADGVQLNILDMPRWQTLQWMTEGVSLGEICEKLPVQFPQESLPVMGWFSHWVQTDVIKKIGLILISIVVFCTASSRAAHLCDDEYVLDYVAQEGSRLEQEFKTKADAKRWTTFTKLLKNTARCLDGGIAEGVADTATTALAEDWEGFVRYATSRKADPDVISIILSLGVAEMVETDTLEIIKSHAKTQCPAALTQTCEKIMQFEVHPMNLSHPVTPAP